MKIKSIEIKNFRSFKDVTIELDSYNAFVGANGAGKSTILCALNVFFRQSEGTATDLKTLDKEDFHNGNTEDPVEITVTFVELSPEAQADFKDYYRQDALIISSKAVFEKATNTAPVRQVGKRLVIEAFANFFAMHDAGAKVAELTEEFNRLKESFDLPKASTKDANKKALREFEEASPQQCSLLDSDDQFYGFSKGANRLDKYVQWVYVPAVKDAASENAETRNSALGKLLARTVRSKVKFDEEIASLKAETQERYRQLLTKQQAALTDISASLTKRMNEWAHPGATARLEWFEDPLKSVQIAEPNARLFAGEGDFSGDLSRFGHGLQRSYLLALLQELASSDDGAQPRLILGCEEPELYQHPPQARHLSAVFQRLTSGNAQVFVSTHSPYFVAGRHFENVRMVRRDDTTGAATVKWTTCAEVSNRLSEVSGETLVPIEAERARLHQALQPHINEMFFAKRLIFVEGLEDVAYITTWLHYTEKWEDFRKAGLHIVAANGKDRLIEPLVIAEKLGIPVFVIFDADANQKGNPSREKAHIRDNTIILKLLDGDHTKPFPSDIVWEKRFICWPENFGKSLRSAIGNELWDPAFTAATNGLGSPEGDFKKNHVHIADHLFALMEAKADMALLDNVCTLLIKI